MSLLPNLDNPKTNRAFLYALLFGAVVWVGACMKACIGSMETEQPTLEVTQ